MRDKEIESQMEELFPIDDEMKEEQSHMTYDTIAQEAFEKAYKEKSRKRRILGDVVWFVVLVIVLYLAFRFLIGLSFVDGKSMYPTLQDGNVVVYTRIYKNYQPNDIIAIRMEDNVFYVKRVIAVEGDKVDIRDGVVLVNGKAVDDDYAWGKTERIAGNVSYPVKVGKNQVFVLGDNREHSVDSRTFGLVYPYQIRGKLLYYAGSLY